LKDSGNDFSFIISAASAYFSNTKPICPSQFSWEGIFRVSVRNKIAPLIYSVFTDKIPEPFKAKFKQTYLFTLSANLYLWKQMEFLSQKLTQAGLSPLFLRGLPFTLEVYGDLGIRASEDIDILVRAKNWEIAYKTLKKLGYSPTPYTPTKIEAGQAPIHTNLFSKGRLVEIHTDILHLTIPVKIEEEIWERKRILQGNETKIYLPSLEHTLANLCIHLHRSGFSIFLWVLDIIGFLQKWKGEIDWHYLKDFSLRTKIHPFLYTVLSMVNQIVPESVPASFLLSIKPHPLIEQIEKYLWRGKPYIEWSKKHHNYSAAWTRFLHLLYPGRYGEKLLYLKKNILPPPAWMKKRYQTNSLFLAYSKRFSQVLKNRVTRG